jgi:hypothetical protein
MELDPNFASAWTGNGNALKDNTTTGRSSTVIYLSLFFSQWVVLLSILESQ